MAALLLIHCICHFRVFENFFMALCLMTAPFYYNLLSLSSAVVAEIALVHCTAGAGPFLVGIFCTAVSAEFSCVLCAAGASPFACGCGLPGAAVIAEIARVLSTAGAFPGVCRSLLSLLLCSRLLCLHLHLSGICLRSGVHKSACSAHSHIHSHKGIACA